MAEEIDFDNMSDEEIDQVLDSIDTIGEINDGVQDEETEAEINEDENSDNEEEKNDDENINESEDEADDTNKEDTDQDEDSEDEADTTDQNDGDDQETSDESEDDDEEENTLVDDGDEDSKDDEADTDELNDGDTKETAIKPDEYEKYKKFYEEVVNAKFVANGKEVEGFKTPEDLIKAQQMAYGFENKMVGFKKYRPLMAPLQDRGMIEDIDKFNLAMNIMDGDEDAIKQHLKSLNIDLDVMDLDTINYSNKNNIASKERLIMDDTMDMARSYGVEDKVKDVIGREWDDESFNELLNDGQSRVDLVKHIQSGVYDTVQNKVAQMSSVDIDGSFNNMSSIAKYKAAVQELNRQAPAIQEPIVNTVDSVNAEKAKIEEKKKEDAYKLKIANENKIASEARKKASSVSKKKKGVRVQKKFDPMDLEDDELDAYVNGLISNR